MSAKDILEQKKKQTYYEILEVPKSVKKIELRKARRKLLSKYHPDKYSGEEKTICEEISSLINKSFEALNDETFRQQYDNSGCKIVYGRIDDYGATTPSKPKKVKQKTKGVSLTAMCHLTKKQMLDGCELEVKYLPVPGKNTGKPTRRITVKPNTKHDSIHVYEGLGEEILEGDNGDLIVLFQCQSSLNNLETIRIITQPDIIYINAKEYIQGNQLDLTDLGIGKISLQYEINKDEERLSSLLLIEESTELDKPLLIEY